MQNLFLVCPDCYIEQAVREKYGNNSYFLTALGTVFDIDTFEYAEEVNQFISSEEVGSIFLVNDYKCTFIQNALFQEKDFNTKSEKVLKSLINSNDEVIASLNSVDDKAKKGGFAKYVVVDDYMTQRYIGYSTDRGILYFDDIAYFERFKGNNEKASNKI